jgi:hypothetical protein
VPRVSGRIRPNGVVFFLSFLVCLGGDARAWKNKSKCGPRGWPRELKGGDIINNTHSKAAAAALRVRRRHHQSALPSRPVHVVPITSQLPPLRGGASTHTRVLRAASRALAAGRRLSCRRQPRPPPPTSSASARAAGRRSTSWRGR